MKKKICFIVSSPMTANAFLLKHFEVLSNDFNIYLVANFSGNNNFHNPHLVAKKNINIGRKINLINDFKSLIFLSKYLFSMKFDAVHSVSPKAGLIGMMAARIVSVPNRIHIFTGQVWATKKGPLRFLLKYLDFLIASLATNILVDGKAQRTFLISENVIKENNSQVLGEGSISGVELDKFTFNEHIRISIRKDLDLNANNIVFGFLGRLTVEKGLLDLAKAFQNIKTRYPNSILLRVGPDEENIRKLINDSVGTNGIIFFGHTNKPSEILHAFDIFCLPSHREGFGTSIIEASAMQLPVICSDTYGLLDTIQDEITGLRHKTYDVPDLIKKMEKLLVNPDLRYKMGMNGNNYVKNNFTATSISNKWLNFYQNLFNSI